MRLMEKLPSSLLDFFMKDEHVIHLSKCPWNGIWSDMTNESIHMKIGKGPAGLAGVSTNEWGVHIWASGHHLCNQVLTELEDLREKSSHEEKNVKKKEKEGFNLMQKTSRCFR